MTSGGRRLEAVFTVLLDAVGPQCDVDRILLKSAPVGLQTMIRINQRLQILLRQMCKRLMILLNAAVQSVSCLLHDILSMLWALCYRSWLVSETLIHAYPDPFLHVETRCARLRVPRSVRPRKMTLVSACRQLNYFPPPAPAPLLAAARAPTRLRPCAPASGAL